MSSANVIEQVNATQISWLGQNPTVKRVRKKKKGKKVTVSVPNKSFFTFFDPIEMPTDEDLKAGKLTVARPDLEKEENVLENEDPEDFNESEQLVDSKPVSEVTSPINSSHQQSLGKQKTLGSKGVTSPKSNTSKKSSNNVTNLFSGSSLIKNKEENKDAF
mmetsp:Transcript_18070/g.30832  ORF Transcript_18070/g.30832 Transcript_18070/m.30832 type:complete len:161 (+) Transcript_18070:588-1070(+)